jgi:hypothetical protein
VFLLGYVLVTSKKKEKIKIISSFWPRVNTHGFFLNSTYSGI